MAPERANDGTTASEAADAKAFLRRLAGADERTVVERADAAVDDLDAAVAFVESGGVDELALAVEATDDPDLEARGERALAAFRRFRAAAAGELDADGFRCGRGTDLRRRDEGTTE